MLTAAAVVGNGLMRSLLVILVIMFASIATAQETGFLVWADASQEGADTGNEVCAPIDRPPQSGFPAKLCLKVFVPGSATEIACDVDMTDAGTDSDYYLVLCH